MVFQVTTPLLRGVCFVQSFLRRFVFVVQTVEVRSWAVECGHA